MKSRGESFGPTSGVLFGWSGLVIAVVLAVATIEGGLEWSDLPVFLLAALVALLSWTVLLRPRVVLHDSEVELRNIVSDRHIPYSLIDSVKVGSRLQIWSGERSYRALGVARSTHLVLRENLPATTTVNGIGAWVPDDSRGLRNDGSIVGDEIGTYVAERLRQARVNAPAGVAGEVRASYAWIEIAGLLALAVALVVSLSL